MNIGVFTRNQHRCNTMLAVFMIEALKELGHNVITHIDANSNTGIDFAFVFNGKLDNDYIDVVYALYNSSIPVVYLIDDVDLELPKTDYVDIFVHQFIGNNVTKKDNIYFPIAELLTMHENWVTGIGEYRDNRFSNKVVFYGGTFKERRDYSVLKNIRDLILACDDIRWEEVISEKALIIPTIRDMDRLYKFMGKECDTTIIVYDEKHYGKGVPLRFFEGALCNLKVYVFNENKNEIVYRPDSIRHLYTKELFLNKLKGLICNIQQLM